jgi:replication initiation and membrane attachment protein
MKDTWKEILPKTIFKAIICSPLSDLEKELLAQLYQPIIGATAFSLYLTLLSEIKPATNQSEELLHADLVMLLDCSLPQVVSARRKLEGIGLLDTFVKDDPELGTVYVYRLNAPESAERFFKDEILSITLLNRIGQRKFELLLESFKPKFLKLTGYENISASFKEVYLFKEEQIIAEAELLAEVQRNFDDPRPKQPLAIESVTFNWNLFSDQLNKLGIRLPEDSKPIKNMILLFHESYGIDELEMANFASRSFDYYTSELDSKELKKQINAVYYPKKRQNEATSLYVNPALSKDDQQTYRYNSLKKLSGFSDKDIQVIMDCEKLAPEQYLGALKEAVNGFPTNIEKYNIRFLIEHSKLPNSVINMLIYYVCYIEKKPVLESEHLNKIANDWARKQITAPEEAMIYVKERTEKSKQQPKKSSFSNRNTRKEVLPDWLDKPNEEQTLSQEEQAKLRERINKLTGKSGDQ